jgi:uncharacterized protein YlxW (UPF0749 family)
MKVLRVFAGVTLTVALAALVVGVLATTRSTASPRDVAAVRAEISKAHEEISSLSAEVSQQRATITQEQSTIATLKNSTTAGKVASLSGQFNHLRGTVSRMGVCIPQVQTELNGLGIQYSINPTNGSQDSFSITNPTIISTDCTKTLYGTG